MNEYTSTYEKLVAMGFDCDAVDIAIANGFYRFEDIFRNLIEQENQMNSNDDQNVIRDFGSSNSICRESTAFSHDPSKLPSVIRRQTEIYGNDNPTLPNFRKSNGDHKSKNSSRKMTSDRRKDLCDLDSIELATYRGLNMQSSTTISSSNLLDSSLKKLCKVNILDLLDISREPLNYRQSFVANLCSVRDLICWLQQERSAATQNSELVSIPSSSSVSLATSVSVGQLVSTFQQHRWHLARPAGSQPLLRIHAGHIDMAIDSIGLDQESHLVAVVGKGLFETIDSPTVDVSMRNDNHCEETSESVTEINNTVHIQIRMVNYEENPLYLSGRPIYRAQYEANSTRLECVLEDFWLQCGSNNSREIAGPWLWSQSNGPPQPLACDTLSQSHLSELGMRGFICLYCHRRPPSTCNYNNNRSASPVSMTLMPLSPDMTSSYPQESNSPPFSLTELCSRAVLAGIKRLSPTKLSLHRLSSTLQQNLLRRLVNTRHLSAITLALFCQTQSTLTILDLSYSGLVTNEVLQIIGRCPGIQELILDNEDSPQFTNEGLWLLRGCLNLRRLSLNYCKGVNDWGLQVMAEMTNLTSLSLRDTGVTNVGLRHLRLRLEATDTDSSSSRNSKSLLTFLDLGGLSITDDCLENVSSAFPVLESLVLTHTQIQDVCSFLRLNKTSGYIALRHLDLSHCPDLVFQGSQLQLRALSLACPRLSSLSIRGLHESGLMHAVLAISRCSGLQREDGLMCHPHMTATLAACLSHLPLHTLVLSGCSHINDSWLPLFARYAPSLSHLVLSRCPAISGHQNCLLAHLSTLNKLAFLDLSHLPAVPPLQIITLLLGRYFPRIQIAWISLSEKHEFLFRSRAKDLCFKVNITRSFDIAQDKD